jgi:alpha-tubulin suppressor-like RCC1 family protein
MSNSKNQIGVGEYLTLIRNPITRLLHNVVAAGSSPSSSLPMIGSPTIAYGEGKISGGYHHGVAIGGDGFAYVCEVDGQNANNIAGNGSSSLSGLVKTPVGNAVYVKALNNAMQNVQNFGAGVAIVTGDGKLILLGNTQSGFRGDGSVGNAAETTPYTVPIPVAVTKIVGLSCLFALGVDGVVYRWGGQGVNDYQMQYFCGAFVGNPDFTRIGTVALPEKIVDITSMGWCTYAKGVSGKWYAWGYDGGYFLMPQNYQKLQYFDITSLLPKGNIVKLRCGVQATYCLMDNGDAYSWGDNMQAAIGNGSEGSFSNYFAPWPGSELTMPGGGEQTLPILTPYKMNPVGVSFVDFWVDNSLSMYYYFEDTNGNLWNGGRNKTYNLWNGQGGDSNTQGANPNKWDVLSPTKIVGFGDLSNVNSGGSTPPPTPPPTKKVIDHIQIFYTDGTNEIKP